MDLYGLVVGVMGVVDVRVQPVPRRARTLDQDMIEGHSVLESMAVVGEWAVKMQILATHMQSVSDQSGLLELMARIVGAEEEGEGRFVWEAGALACYPMFAASLEGKPARLWIVVVVEEANLKNMAAGPEKEYNSSSWT
jgi:hypothetical protein